MDARFNPVLDDSVMINRAVLYPVLTPQRRDLATWFTALSTGKRRKDDDGSHLARRYWSTRINTKCQVDTSPERRPRERDELVGEPQGALFGA